MKSPEEKKYRILSVRVSENMYSEIKTKADERNMSVSKFMSLSAVHSDKSLTPMQLVQIQNLTNMVSAACEEMNPELAETMRKEAGAIWQSLSK